mmetsp:Transcript_42467/g.43033  ORF Transcript_42467/g.43033 Transcript_42467/m.43033 type:complete len:303 (+) Transcript_42467:126-1034(+)
MTNSIVSRRGVLWLAFTCIHLERTVTNGYTIHSSPAVGRQTQRMSFALSASRSDDKVSTTPTQQRSSKFPDHIDMQRREWMQRTAGIVAGSVSTLSTCANAATTDTTAPTTTITPKTMKGLALCDSNVSTFTKNGRTVHLLGTAHISSVSAQLAGRVVRETSPDAVFVELDAKRVDRVFLPESEANQQLVSNAPTAVQSNTKKSPFGFIETIKKAPAALVGKTISNMYKKTGIGRSQCRRRILGCCERRIETQCCHCARGSGCRRNVAASHHGHIQNELQTIIECRQSNRRTNDQYLAHGNH